VQIIMLATLIYYDYKVVEKSDLLPNMVAVMAAGALFGIVCAINTGMIL
jgi:hypothetical protein